MLLVRRLALDCEVRPFRPKTDLKLSRRLPSDISSWADFLASFPVIAAEIEGAPRATDKNWQVINQPSLWRGTKGIAIASRVGDRRTGGG